jgi:putative phosphoesterase
MLVGVVSDTHNNIKNIKKIICLFNEEQVCLVIHTGDISKAETLRNFSELDAPLVGVFGNNDRIEEGLKEVCEEYNFKFQEPPLSLTLENKKIAVFHEPDLIKDYIKEHKDIDLILYGHTHRYKEEKIDKTVYFNPGESAGSMEGKSALGIVNLNDLEIRRIFF